ncbi:UDP-N-acetylmuramate--L-alanine ligase [Roseisolibacter agri]|uniref:UDP-N-acetylmuramate--L-alanine ligase n=1 Tax=Roseisolibacter agri TaxID=2014610 RepID=A0AA37VBI9_9BACT|nr:UDP-N-acetylmuramate--L-alanine ligase [Roseisolibacter agri]GLC26488.1 UDP-N-acetylmuramate--L-alanine ligase [Roseisolibacter agri]
MPLLLNPDPRPVHFVGIAGAGMSALAELFVRRGATVTGCDANPAQVDDLRRLGVEVTAGHDPAHVAGARALVVTSAMPKDHPELEAARAAGLPVIRRAEALAEAIAGGACIGIAGTHGKTTTTVLTTEALAAAGLAPTGVVGGRVGAWGGNLRFDGVERFVVEADEYDRSFLALTPTVAVVTNVEADHLDIYADLDDIRATFAEFVSRARFAVACADDAGANALPYPTTSEVVRYGVAAPHPHPDARLVAHDLRVEPRADGDRTVFDVVYDGKPLGAVALRVPGAHNVRNALAAIGVGLLLGATLDAMRPGLEAFGGVERRFQRLGEAGGVQVVDDYAHHPTEVAATLAAARTAYPGRRVVAAFQPHLFTRTRDFAGAFGEALAGADSVFLTEIYQAREQPIAGVTAGLVEEAARAAGRPVTWRGPRDGLAEALASHVAPGDVVLTLGAGDVTRTGPELLARLSGRDA